MVFGAGAYMGQDWGELDTDNTFPDWGDWDFYRVEDEEIPDWIDAQIEDSVFCDLCRRFALIDEYKFDEFSQLGCCEDCFYDHGIDQWQQKMMNEVMLWG